jgi:hypothetical protein
MGEFRPEFGPLFGPEKSISAGENMFVVDSALFRALHSLRSRADTRNFVDIEHQIKGLEFESPHLGGQSATQLFSSELHQMMLAPGQPRARLAARSGISFAVPRDCVALCLSS